MFVKLLSFELKYHFRQLIVVGSAVAFFVLGVLGTKANFGGPEVMVNAPFGIAYYTALLTLFALIILTLITASALLRDSRHRFEEIVFTTTVTKKAYLGTRFCGIVVVTLAILTISTIGMMCGLLLAHPDRVGSFSLLHYIQPLIVFGLPNVLFGASILFAAALTTRSTIAVFVAGALIYILYMVGSIIGNSPLMANATMDGAGSDLLPTLLDPFGLVGFLGQARYWTPAERNSLMVNPEGAFLVNRILWVFISISVFALVYKTFQFRTISRSRTRRKKDSPSTSAPDSIRTSYTPVEPEWQGFIASVRSWFSTTLLQTKVTVRSIPFVILMLLWLFLIFVTLSERLYSGPFNTSYYPTTNQIASLILGPLNQLGAFVAIFYAGELVWSDRHHRIHELIDATPVSSFSLALSKFGTLIAVLFLFITAAIVAGISFQLSAGYARFQFPFYLSLYFYAGVPLACISALAIGIQNLLNNKFAAILLTIGIVLFVAQPRSFGLEHPLLRFAAMPPVSLSNMNAFGYGAPAFKVLGLYWLSLSAIILIVSAASWRRGSRTAVLRRLKGLKLVPPQRIALAFFATIFLLSGAYVFREINLKESYQTRAAFLDAREEYEKTYKVYSQYKQPTISHIEMNVALFPDQRRYSIAGSYKMVNYHSEPLTSLIFSVHPEVGSAHITTQSPGSTSVDHEHGIHVIELEQTVASGDSLNVDFNLEVSRAGYTRFNSENSILSNGSFIEIEDFLPAPGYDAEKEITNPEERTRRGLPPIASPTAPQDAPPSVYRNVTYTTNVSAPSDQRLVTVGRLVDSRVEGSRTHYQFVSPKPATFQFAIALADYEVETSEMDGVTYEIFYHPGHESNISQLMDHARKSISLFEDLFGPYPYDYYRIAEIPHYVGAATAYPGVVFITEQVGFLLDTRDSSRVNTLQLLAAHETAHQWFGHQVQPSEIAGYSVLTETISQYAELLFLKRHGSSRHIREHLTSELDFYLGRRGYLLNEPPLYLASGPAQTHIYYQKGSLAMYALHDLLGEPVMTRALRELTTNHVSPGERPTTLDFIELLKRESAADLHPAIDNWLQEVVFYDLAVDDVSVVPDSSGRYLVSIDIQAGRSRVDAKSGEETVDVLVEDVAIALLEDHPDNSYALNHPLLIEKATLYSGINSVTFSVSEAPAYIVVDPFSYRPDRDRYDNVFRIVDR